MIRAGGDMRKIIVILAVLAAVTACKKTETATQSTQSTTTQATETSATITPVPQSTTETTAPTAAPATVGVIASSDGEISGVKFEVVELKRSSGGTVNLKFVLNNSSNKPFALSGYYLGDSDVSADSYRNVSGIHLVDPVNKKKYFVVTDSNKKCLCSNAVADVEAGGRSTLWAKFPAPPPEVTRVTVEVPHFQPMDDVPISQ
jgi:hypothetical protein